MRWTLAALAAPLAVGLALTVVTLGKRGAGAAFAYQQTHLSSLTTQQVEALVSTAPAPVPQSRPGARATCRAQGFGQLRNPWRCVLRYPSGLEIPYQVTIRGNGSYYGLNLRDRVSTIGGCCVSVGAG